MSGYSAESYVDKQGRIWSAGQVFLSKHDTGGPWSHCLILGFSTGPGEEFARVSRPYAYASCVGTTGPTVMLGCETWDMPVSKLEHETPLCEGGRFVT